MKRTPLKRTGFLKRGGPHRRIDGARAEALYAAGKSTTEIGRIMDRDASAISRVLKRRGVQARTGRDYYNLPSLSDVERLYVDEELSMLEVAQRLGIARTTVTRMLREAGVLTRRPGRQDGTPGNREPAFMTEFRRMRPLVVARAHGACEVRADDRCRGAGTHVHHRKLRSQGGDNSLENLLLACIACHGVVHAIGEEAYRRGWLVFSYQEPAEVPVERFCDGEEAA